MSTTTADGTDETVVGVRERKKLATRAALIHAAQHLVLAHGLDGFTVEDLCERAGVARRTFFNYFESKDDAAIGWSEETLPTAALAGFAAGGPHGDLSQDLVELARAILTTHDFDAASAHRKGELVRTEPRLLLRQMYLFEQGITRAGGLFEERRAVRLDEPAVDPQVGAFALFNLVRTCHRLWETDGERGPVVAHLPEAVSQLHTLSALGCARAAPAHAPSATSSHPNENHRLELQP